MRHGPEICTIRFTLEKRLFSMTRISGRFKNKRVRNKFIFLIPELRNMSSEKKKRSRGKRVFRVFGEVQLVNKWRVVSTVKR